MAIPIEDIYYYLTRCIYFIVLKLYLFIYKLQCDAEC